ncbi:Hypp7821 [Branchiostoma lanceolatum]|uniref:Hypp7821 protein n=1 Tax=Branchiostoma lanceolatum TaxID=7740 RepID=A0A8K0EDR9_BRALA|nr:Hypp7821 [Branchiostoma lanceolatum]
MVPAVPSACPGDLVSPTELFRKGRNSTPQLRRLQERLPAVSALPELFLAQLPSQTVGNLSWSRPIVSGLAIVATSRAETGLPHDLAAIMASASSWT